MRIPSPAPKPGTRLRDEDADDIAPGLFEALRGIPQDPRHHSEGDVETHVRLVADALLSSEAYAELDEKGRRIAFAAALLHDVGKPSRTKIEPDGSVTSRGHSPAGAILARLALWRREIPIDEREAACRIVAAHQVPFRLMERERPEAALIRLALDLDPAVLVAVAEADARGRSTLDPSEARKAIDAVLLLDVLRKDTFVEDAVAALKTAPPHARFTWAKDPLGRDPFSPVHDDRRGTLTLLCGPPGAGKDTWLRENAPSLPVVSLDAIRNELRHPDPGIVVQEALERARAGLRSGRDFAWNSTNMTREQRGKILSLALDYRFSIRIVHLEQPEAELRARNAARKDAVPNDAVDRFLSRWEAPVPTEAHELVLAGNDERKRERGSKCLTGRRGNDERT
jgi:predicted kinase